MAGSSTSPYSSSSSAAARPDASSRRPSLSPSITSLLNPDTNGSATNDTDYFFAAPSDRDFFATPSSPVQQRKQQQSAGLLSARDAARGDSRATSEEVAAGDAPRTMKRPRSSSSAADETNGQMPPPPPRRDSSGQLKRPASATSSATSSPRSSALPSPLPPAPRAAPPPAAPSSAGGRPTLEPSIFNVDPIDEFTREVADWLWGFCSHLPWREGNVEIEAKLGVLTDRRVTHGPPQRWTLPVAVETIITDDSEFRFQSSMTINQHKGFNQLLNSRVEETATRGYPGSQVRYAHTREIDTFHEVPIVGGSGRRKVRVTRDQRDPTKVLRVIQKERIADMNVYSPKRLFDWRLSVSMESPEAHLPNVEPSLSRSKDRISYTHQLFTVDLTQVSQPKAPDLHELEIEFKDARVLLAEAQKDADGLDNQYLEMVACLLNNIRMLVRNASDP